LVTGRTGFTGFPYIVGSCRCPFLNSDSLSRMPEPTPSVVLDHVSVAYGKNAALHDVSAVFPPGAVGLLGPNGAGKSTMLKSLLGFIPPTSGRLEVLGLNVAERPLDVRARLGYMPENDGHIPGMNAVTFVAYCGQLAGLPKADSMQRAHEVLYYVGLGEARYRNVETYSTGMKQRIKLAQALVHDPDLLFLDEPTNGMDPKGREEILELIRDLARNKGVNLILSSHLLPDVEYTCDHVVVLDKGAIATFGTIDALKGPAGRVFEVRVKGDLAPFIDRLEAAGWKCQETEEDVMRVFVPGATGVPGDDQRRLCELAVQSSVQVRHLKASLPSLEDVFARAIGEK
jgi:ABC-2 type transport system ATP-binding protein